MWDTLPIEIQELILDLYTFTCTSDSLICKQFYQKNKKLNITHGITVPLYRIEQIAYSYPLKVNITDINFKMYSTIHLFDINFVLDQYRLIWF